MKLYIKTLTPVHIGTGKELEKFEYTIDDGYFKRISFGKLSNLLMDKYPDEFQKWVNELSRTENSSNLLTLDNIKNKVAGNRKIEDEVNESTIYLMGCNFNPANKIRECIKSGNNDLFIPGSSIKGMVRTALLYDAVWRLDSTQIKKYYQDNVKLINDPKVNNKKNKLKENCDKELEQTVFYCGVKKDGRENYSDEKYDLMKLIQISDSNCIESKLFGRIVDVKMFKLEKADKSKDLICAETINRNSILEFDISVNVELIEKIKTELKNENSGIGTNDWIGFRDKINFLFKDNLFELDKSKIQETIINHILNCINNFGNAIFVQEKKWLESVSGKVNSDIIKSFYSLSPKDFIKIGYATGFPGTTLFLWALTLPDQLQKIFDFFQIGYHRSTKTNANIKEFPITRRYDEVNNQISALGWIQISKDEFEISEVNESESVSSSEVVKKEGWVEAEIVQIKKKPYKIKILEGEMKDQELNFQYGNVEDLEIGKRVYVSVTVNKKQKLDSKTEFKGFVG